MLSAPTTAPTAALQAIVVACAAGAFGYLLVSCLLPRAARVLLWALSFPALYAFALVCTTIHIVSGGWLLASPWAVRAIVLAVALGCILVRRSRNVPAAERVPGDARAALAVVVIAVALTSTPLLRILPLPADPDIQLHMGWSAQLLNGETTPSAPITGDVPNYYPWGWHGLVAFLSAFTPGGHPMFALGPLQLLQVAGSVLALFGLGRVLTERWIGGAAAALFGAVSGGFGFFALRSMDIVMFAEDDLSYGGDLLFWRSYNASMHNLPPPYPRDIAFALFVSFLVLCAVAYRDRDRVSLVGAGVVLGLLGLTGGEAFIVAGTASLALVAFGFPHNDSRALGRGRAALLLLGPAAALYALWLVPIAVNYVDLGGFVNTTRIEPVTLPAWAVLVSWGLTLPFALAAVFGLRTLWRSPARVLLVGALSALAWVVVAPRMPGVLGEAFDALGRAHRYWPMFYLCLAALAGIGVVRVLSALPRAAVPAVAGLVVLVAVASPAVGAWALADEFESYDAAALFGAAATQDKNSFLLELGEPGARCVAAVPPKLSRAAFGYSGYRLVLWKGGAEGPNLARIRWTDIYDRIVSSDRRVRDNEALLTGPIDDEVVKRYDLDLVVPESGPATRLADCD